MLLDVLMWVVIAAGWGTLVTFLLIHGSGPRLPKRLKRRG